MIPTLFEIPIFGGIPVHSFGLMMATAFLSCSFVLRRLFKDSGYSEEVAEQVILVAAFAGILGSKLYYLFFEAFDRFKRHPMEMLFSGAGLTWYGGLVLATLAIIWLLHKRGIPWLKGVDLIAIPLPLGYGIGRIGCHLSGDGDYGLPYDGLFATNYSKGIVPPSDAFRGTDIAKAFPNGEVPNDTLCHPTPMYETFLSVIIFFILWRLARKKLPDGAIISIYAALAGIERFGIEFMRLNPKVAWGLSGAQVLSLVLIGVGLTGLSMSYKYQRVKA